MSDFTYQEGTALTWAQMNENLRLMQAKYLDSANSAAIAVAAANFKGNWTALTGALAVPAAVYHSSKFWLLLSSLADVTAKVPGVDAEWLEIITGNVMGPASATDGHAAIFDGATGKLLKSGPIAQALGSASLPSYTFSGDVNTGMWSPGADILAWSTGGSERLRINTIGKVGVGTSAPDSYVGNTLQINGSSASLRITDATSGATKDDGVELYMSGGVAELMQRENALLGFGTNSLRRMVIDATGNVLVTGSGGLGYGTGSGGTVTQATSKSTSVTLNKPSGRITMNNAALAANTGVNFLLSNSAIAATDCVVVTPVAGSVGANQAYQAWVELVDNGQCSIVLKNITGASRSEAVQLNFSVIKGATS